MKKYGSIEVQFNGHYVIIYNTKETIAMNCDHITSAKINADGIVWITVGDDYYDLEIGHPEAGYFLNNLIKHIHDLQKGRSELTQLQTDNARLEKEVLKSWWKQFGGDV